MSTAGFNALAVIHAADAMLQALGGDAVTVVFPLLTLPNDPSAQLGLQDPGTQEVSFSPVAVRTLTSPSTGPRRHLEFLISATAVAAAVVSQNVASAETLFDSALGVNYDNTLFRVENVAAEYFAGTAYLYKVTAVE
jgi:hypothetical protein